MNKIHVDRFMLAIEKVVSTIVDIALTTFFYLGFSLAANSLNHLPSNEAKLLIASNTI